jgi:exosome complex component RRP42
MGSRDVAASVSRKRIGELLIQDKRLDGRGLLDYREIKVETGLIEKANGSALVCLGDTKVLVGVKVEIGPPFPDTPDEGVLTVNAELVPLASPSFEPGPPNEESIELARVVDRGIRESKALDTKRLSLVAGRKVLVVYVDIYVLDHDGNLFDASALASILALTTARVREYKLFGDEVLPGDGLKPLPLRSHPVSVTIARIGDKLIVDPSLEEEAAVDAHITIAVDDAGNICAIQKSKPGTLSVKDIFDAARIAQAKARELRERFIGGYIHES